jgi:hypothetical protein
VTALTVFCTRFDSPDAIVCDAREAPAETDRDVGAPHETNESKERDESESAPRQERNGKGGRRIRGSDQSADRRVMNA